MTPVRFPPTRADGLHRLAEFVPRAGRDYAVGRNTDEGPSQPSHVSMLSPYLRHRLITEREVLESVLERHSLVAAEKYVQEILWRTYWKGWMEMHPGVWTRFLEERDRARVGFPDDRAIASAENGMTGIEGFDDWARELVATGYLHNHARMWFASIWIFTLRLPWTLGADFFLRHLIDADAASNILSWRWVAGLQTAGKTYLATADNIARYTGGRFAPKGLAQEAVALTEAPLETAAALQVEGAYNPRQPALLLVTHEDMNPESLFPQGMINTAVIAADDTLLWGDKTRQFTKAAAADTASRVKAHFGCPVLVTSALDLKSLILAAQAAEVRQIITPYAPVGSVADALTVIAPALADGGIALVQVRRGWDAQFWPHAKKGFFPFKERIPTILREDGLL